jgi:hypothetical protein
MLNILKSSFVMPPPLDEELASELWGITTTLKPIMEVEGIFYDEECYD